jgi:hypothetical protein
VNKPLLLAILSAAVLLTAYLLWTVPAVPSLTLSSIDDSESIILSILNRHAITEGEVKTRVIEFDNGSKRVIHTVGVPPAWPKTRFHLDLNDTLRKVGLDTYGVVEFPDRQLRVHVLYRGKVVRTVALNTDRNAL